LASTINEWQVFYVTYIHERGTELRCYSFLFTSIRLQACCVNHFYSCSFSMHDLRFKCACGYFISHTFISDHWLCNIFSTHLTTYCFLEVHISGSHETLFCRLFLLFLFSPYNVWSLFYMLFSINFTLVYITFYYWSRITAGICATSAQRHNYWYMFWSLDLLQGPPKYSAQTSMTIHVFWYCICYTFIFTYIFLYTWMQKSSS